MTRASTKEILNLRALIVDLSTVSDIALADSDISMNTHVFHKIKSRLPSTDIDMEAITTNLQRLIICPTHLREAWSGRMARVQNSGPGNDFLSLCFTTPLKRLWQLSIRFRPWWQRVKKSRRTLDAFPRYISLQINTILHKPKSLPLSWRNIVAQQPVTNVGYIYKFSCRLSMTW